MEKASPLLERNDGISLKNGSAMAYLNSFQRAIKSKAAVVFRPKPKVGLSEISNSDEYSEFKQAFLDTEDDEFIKLTQSFDSTHMTLDDTSHFRNTHFYANGRALI